MMICESSLRFIKVLWTDYNIILTYTMSSIKHSQSVTMVTYIPLSGIMLLSLLHPGIHLH